MTKDEALNIAIDYMNERLKEHDAKFQRHPVAEAERDNILADIEAVKEALSQPWEKFCDSNCVWTDHHPDCKLVERLPLTDEEIFEINNGLATWMFPVETRVTDRELAFARAIEAKVWEKQK